MRWRYIIHVAGLLILSLGLTMTFPLIVGLYYGDKSLFPMLSSILITSLCGVFMYIGSRGITIESISTREGMGIVSFSWVAVGIFGALPFYLGIDSCTLTDAIFESI
jgi:trk system potassium uptake protein TrkH